MLSALTSIALSARTSLYARRRRSSLRSAVIVPPATPGSVGDAAMISVAIAELRKRGFERIDLLHGRSWPVDEQVDRLISAEAFFYNGRASQGRQLRRLMTQYDYVCFIGADVIDGAYNPGSVSRRLELLECASKAGIATTVLGSSYNDAPEETTRSALAKLPKATQISARDPVAYTRLATHLKRDIVQTADLAFLLSPRTNDPETVRLAAWVARQRAAGKEVLAVNANYLHAAKNPAFEASLTKFLHGLNTAGIAILLVPHDTRTKRNDRQVLEDAAKAIDRDSIELVRTTSPGAIKAILSQVDALFTGRLHAMILAMGAGTPAGGLAYQGKFEGMLQLFQLDNSDLLMSPEDFAGDPDKALELAFSLLRRKTEIRQKIEARLSAVHELSSKNFALA